MQTWDTVLCIWSLLASSDALSVWYLDLVSTSPLRWAFRSCFPFKHETMFCVWSIHLYPPSFTEKKHVIMGWPLVKASRKRCTIINLSEGSDSGTNTTNSSSGSPMDPLSISSFIIFQHEFLFSYMFGPDIFDVVRWRKVAGWNFWVLADIPWQGWGLDAGCRMCHGGMYACVWIRRRRIYPELYRNRILRHQL